MKKLLLKGAEAFAKESGKELAKALFSALFGKSEGLSKEEFEAILRRELQRITEELKQHIDAAFLKQKENEAVLALRELESLLAQYHASDYTSVDLLTSATERATEALIAFDDIGASAIHHFAIAASLMIVVYEERAAAISEEQLAVISNEIVPMAIGTIGRMLSKTEELAARRVQIWRNGVFGEDGETVIEVRYGLSVDGETIARGGSSRHGSAPNNLVNLAAEYRQRFVTEVQLELDWAPDLIGAWEEQYMPSDQDKGYQLLPADFQIVRESK